MYLEFFVPPEVKRRWLWELGYIDLFYFLVLFWFVVVVTLTQREQSSDSD